LEIKKIKIKKKIAGGALRLTPDSVFTKAIIDSVKSGVESQILNNHVSTSSYDSSFPSSISNV